jgi:EAL domain-containing protein (putative c-di-GMP-specific phosphodiesterase class I)
VVVWVAWQRRRPALGQGHLPLVEFVADALGADRGAGTSSTSEETRERVAGALRGGELRPVYQPIVALGTSRPLGVEALSRFRDGRGPDRWFADAERVGLGRALELSAIRVALGGFPALSDGQYMSINASPATLESAELHRLLDAVPAKRVVVELTEHAQVDDYERLLAAIALLRGRGVRIAVDDIGSGFASFAHVLTLRPDILKLDISITRDIDTDPARRALARGVVSIARDLGAVVVAEGIETAGELNTVLDVGIDAGQGYFLARPGQLPVPTEYPRPSNRVLDDRGNPVADDDLLGYVTRAWIRTNDLESVARSFLQLVQARTGMQTSYLTIVDPDTGALDHRYVHNAGPIELPEGIVIPWEDTLCKRARDAGIRWTPDVPTDLPGCAAAEAFGVSTFLSVPVIRPDGTTAGTLCAASTEHRNLGDAVIDEIELMARLLADRIDAEH